MDKFSKVIGFFMKIVNNEEVKRKNKEIKDNLLQEMKIYGENELKSHIERCVFDKKGKCHTSFKKNTVFQYEVNNFNLRLFMNLIPFIGMQLRKFTGFHKSNQQRHQELEIRIAYYKITNLITKKEEEKNLLSCMSDGKLSSKEGWS